MSADIKINVQSPTTQVLGWLKSGFSDFCSRPFIALSYGIAFFILSWAVIGGLWLTGLQWMLLPAVAGALLVGPVVAVGLYQISRTLRDSVKNEVAAPGQIALVGVTLMVLLLVWLRAATIIFALFFGLKPFPGFIELLSTIFLTIEGIALLVTGSLVGGLFAAFTFAISVYSIPMLVNEKIDAFTAMGKSFSKSSHNMAVTLRWGALITVLMIVGFATGLVGMIIIFPVLGFATWHAYEDVFSQQEREDTSVSISELK